MKKFLLIVITNLLIISCSSKYLAIPVECYKNGLVAFAFDIENNPDKLLDLNKYYPQFYDEQYLFPTLRDSLEITETVQNIKMDFRDIPEEYIPAKLGFHYTNIMSMNLIAKTNFHFNNDQLIFFGLLKPEHNMSLDFIFIKVDSTKYYLFHIQTDSINVEM